MNRKTGLLCLAGLLTIVTLSRGAAAQGLAEDTGASEFLTHCATCHTDPPGEHTPAAASLKQMTPERIYQTLTTGVMQSIAANLTDEQKVRIAEFLGGRKFDPTNVDAGEKMPNVCSAKPPINNLQAPGWNGWGADLANTRFQPAQQSQMTTGQAARLQLKWTFGFPNATAVYAHALVDGRLYVSSNAGYVYALDAKTGCVYWTFRPQSAVRSGFTVGPVKGGSGNAAFFGDIHGHVYAVDAFTGEELWRVRVDEHPLTRIASGPKLYEGRLYVPVASLEEPESGSQNYTCCTFRGMVVALNAETGKQIWKTYTIKETPKVLRKNSLGKDVMGPSGGGVWTSPVVDVKRRALYITTGNQFNDPPVDTTDAIMALDMDTGAIRWTVQTLEKDVWHLGCPQVVPGRPNRGVREGYPLENCPDMPGPDWDYAASPILARTAAGRELILAAQKPGWIFALDPDRKGAIVWETDVARGVRGGGGEIVFGGAADSEKVYYGIHTGGLVAVDLSTGVERWYRALTPSPGMEKHPGIVGAVSLTPGVIFAGGMDGMVRAFAPFDGNILWEFDTNREFETANGLKAKGGSVGLGAPFAAGGMLFVGSGHVGFQGGAPGNLLLAFEPWQTK